VSLLVTTIPELFQVMEHGLTLVIATGFFAVFLLKIVLATALINASKLALFGLKHLFVLIGLLCLFLLFFLLEV